MNTRLLNLARMTEVHGAGKLGKQPGARTIVKDIRGSMCLGDVAVIQRSKVYSGLGFFLQKVNYTLEHGNQVTEETIKRTSFSFKSLTKQMAKTFKRYFA